LTSLSCNFFQISYELEDHKDLFAIDPLTGSITTRVVFDREERDFYNVKVVAKDSSESSLTPGGPNRGEQVSSAIPMALHLLCTWS